MNIYDYKRKESVKNLTLYLSSQDIYQMISYLEDMVTAGQSDHSHLTSEDVQTEITLVVYNRNNLKDFDDDSKRVIEESR